MCSHRKEYDFIRVCSSEVELVSHICSSSSTVQGEQVCFELLAACSVKAMLCSVLAESEHEQIA